MNEPADAPASPPGSFEAALARTRLILRGAFGRHRDEPADIPVPVLASAYKTPAVLDYAMWWITHANPAGTFAAKTRWLRWLPAPLLLRTMFVLGYDGLIYRSGDHVVGHVFFQRRSAAMHGFSTAVNAPLDGRGYSVILIADYLAYASQVPGVDRARVGRGQNNVTKRFLQRLEQHERELGWRVDADGWVTFRHNAGGERLRRGYSNDLSSS